MSSIGSVLTSPRGRSLTARTLGRSYAESPEIDGYIHFTGAEIEPGSFVRIRITGVLDGEAFGVKV